MQSESRFKICLQDFMERYFQYVYDLCKKKFSSWEIREAYLGGLESTSSLNNNLQLQNVDQAVKLFPDIQELFCRVFNGYMGRDEDCRVQKRKHLFQFFLQEFLCEMSKKLIRKQSTDKTVRDIMTIMSGDDRRANVDFCLQKALGATSKYDSDVTGEITSQDSVSSIGNSKTTFNSRLRKDIEKASLASQRTLTPGLTQDVLRNIDAMAVDAQTPIAVTAVSSAVSSKQPNAVSSAVSLKQLTAVSSKPPTVTSSTVASSTVSSAVSSKPPTTVSSAASTKPPTVASSAVSSSASTAVSTKPPTVVSTAVSTKPPTVVSSIVSSVDSDDSDDDDDDSGISKEYLSKMNKPQVGLMARARQMPSIKNNLSDDDDDDDDDEDDYKEDDDDDSGSGSGSDSDGDTVVKKTPTVNKKKPMKLNNPGKKSPIKKKLPAKKKSPLKKKSPPKKQNIFQKLRN